MQHFNEVLLLTMATIMITIIIIKYHMDKVKKKKQLLLNTTLDFSCFEFFLKAFFYRQNFA